MIALVSLHQVVLLLNFNDLAQSHLALGWKVSELTDFCKLQEMRCLGKKGQGHLISSLQEREPGFSSHPSVQHMNRIAGGEMAEHSPCVFWTWQKCRFIMVAEKGETAIHRKSDFINSSVH